MIAILIITPEEKRGYCKQNFLKSSDRHQRVAARSGAFVSWSKNSKRGDRALRAVVILIGWSA
jgi:hypothetical protein